MRSWHAPISTTISTTRAVTKNVPPAATAATSAATPAWVPAVHLNHRRSPGWQGPGVKAVMARVRRCPLTPSLTKPARADALSASNPDGRKLRPAAAG